MNWINVKDQLPICTMKEENLPNGVYINIPIGEYVLAFYKDKDGEDTINRVLFFGRAGTDDQVWHSMTNKGELFHPYPTYWMPLPEKPNEMD
jgi:hypothetical protein